MSGQQRVVIVGAGLAGYRTAVELREAGFTGPVTLIGAEPHLPYDRPPLSKQLLAGSMTPEQLAHTDDEQLARLDIGLLVGRTATGVDPAEQTVRLDDGRLVPFDHLVVATGAAPRSLPLPRPAGVHVLRTLDDALALRSALATARRLVLIGAGLIGFEIASVATELGIDVTIIEAQAAPLARSVGAQVGARLRRHAEDAGVHLLCSTTVQDIRGVPRVHEVITDGGRSLPADVVVICAGAVPNTGWLAGTPLPATEQGLICDQSGAVQGHAGIWAVGDVASWWDPAQGRHQRREHWTQATEQARIVAHNIATNDSRRLEVVPYFWSNQFGRRIQGVGEPGLASDVRVEDGPSGLTALFGSQGTLTAAVVIDQPRRVAALRRWVHDRVCFEWAVEAQAATAADSQLPHPPTSQLLATRGVS